MTLVKDSRYKIGPRHAPPAATVAPSSVVSIVAAATPVTLWNTTPNRTATIRKLHIENRAGAQTRVEIGTGLGAGFVAALPGFYLPASSDGEYTEDMIVAVEFSTAITVQASVAGAAPADVRIMPEVEEYIGTSG